MVSGDGFSERGTAFAEEDCGAVGGSGLYSGELGWRVTAPSSGLAAVRWFLVRAGEPLGLPASDGGEDGLAAFVPRKQEDRGLLGSWL